MNRLSALRAAMQHAGIATYIVPMGDPHLSEYCPEEWQVIRFLSGFDGSSGRLVVTATEALLFTDSRYFIQATLQLQGSEITLMREGICETPTWQAWIATHTPTEGTVAIDSRLISATDYHELTASLSQRIVTTFDPLPSLWKERPLPSPAPLFLHDTTFAGEGAEEKIEKLRAEMQQLKLDYLLVTALDEVAWLLNIRGNDTKYTPVVTAFVVVGRKEIFLFIDPKKLPCRTLPYHTAPYQAIDDFLATLPTECRIGMDQKTTNQHLRQITSGTVINCPSPIALPKALRNTTQLEGVRHTMIREGVVLTRLYRWIEAEIGTKKITEIAIADQLIALRKEQDNYVEESFAAIVGYNAHGAIGHYHATAESNATLHPQGILLIDTGGQYLDGTTDITRTTALGTPSPQQIMDYTLVLKGHIAIATTRFPQGTQGTQIDAFARRALWNAGLNYGHGTGHGIGHFLNVHEGPQGIRIRENKQPLLPTMLMTNEPGLYREGEWGIRLENLLLISHDVTTPFGQFYGFETLSLYPFDRTLIDIKLLSADELAWVNNYHKRVYALLAPHLTSEEQAWLQYKTKLLS